MSTKQDITDALEKLSPHVDHCEWVRATVEAIKKGVRLPEALGWGYAKIRETMQAIAVLVPELKSEVIPERWAGRVDPELLVTVSQQLADMKDRGREVWCRRPLRAD